MSSGKIDKNEYLKGEEILPSDQIRIVKETKLSYSRIGKAFRKQKYVIKDQGRKQVEALQILRPVKEQKSKSIEDIFPIDQQNNEIKKELNQIKKQKNKSIEKT